MSALAVGASTTEMDTAVGKFKTEFDKVKDGLTAEDAEKLQLQLRNTQIVRLLKTLMQLETFIKL